MTTTDIKEAREHHETCGGFLLDLGNGVYFVTNDHPSEHRSFVDFQEAVDYGMRLAAAGYDETKMEILI